MSKDIKDQGRKVSFATLAEGIHIPGQGTLDKVLDPTRVGSKVLSILLRDGCLELTLRDNSRGTVLVPLTFVSHLVLAKD